LSPHTTIKNKEKAKRGNCRMNDLLFKQIQK
jgi:hypothetical protein